MSYFAKKFKELREKKELFQKDIAEELGITRTAVTEWENGRNTPTVDMLCKIADYFDVTPNYLLGYENEKTDTINKVSDNKAIG